MTDERGIGFGFKIYGYYMYKKADNLLCAVDQYYLMCRSSVLKTESSQLTFFNQLQLLFRIVML